MIETTGERKSAVATPDGKSRKKKKLEGGREGRTKGGREGGGGREGEWERRSE